MATGIGRRSSARQAKVECRPGAESGARAPSQRARRGQLEIIRGPPRTQLNELRALTSLLLTPPAAAGEPDPSAHHSRWEEARELKIVVVGAHERLHARLRKELPNGVFLHPDRKVSADVFNGAGAVLFCVGYCSHALSWFAAQEVRRLGLRAGYTNYNNVELVLDDLRAIVSCNGADKSAISAA
jgi:hypothetical protein